jgi:hypothetical protein
MDFFGTIGSYLKNIGLSLFGQLKATIASFLNDFVKDDLGTLAVDAVQYAENLGGDGASKREAAKAKLLDDLTRAGHDAAQFGESVLNFLIETGLQALLAAASKGVLAIKD